MLTILTLSGFDPSGGAGVHADIKTARALGFHAVSSVTALTVQNTCGVRRVYPVEKEVIVEQVKAVTDDFEIAGVKIGVVPNTDVASGIAEVVSGINAVKVLDPVINAGAGGRLGEVESYRMLMKHVDVITPNFEEARVLSGISDISDTSKGTFLSTRHRVAELAARELRKRYGVRVVVTGGELGGKDLVVEDRTYFVEAEFSPIHIHGTGCVYSTALTCYLAKGKSLEDAVRMARIFVLESVKKAVRSGKCYPIVNP